MKKIVITVEISDLYEIINDDELKRLITYVVQDKVRPVDKPHVQVEVVEHE